MIVWLASYPKSGNTWIRSIISSLLYSKDGDFNFELLKKIQQFPEKKFFKDIIKEFSSFDEIKKNWILAQDKINFENKIKLFKTHQGKYSVGNDNFTNEDNTLAIIYIVRDPRNLVKSISNHYSLSLDEASKFLFSTKLVGNGKSWLEKQDGMYNLLGRWDDHYRSWTRNKSNLLVIKYEDLVTNPNIVLDKIIIFLKRYLNFETNKNKNKKILETTSFENLKKMEDDGQFKENVLNKKEENKVKFFHLGPKNIWQNTLGDKIIKEIEKNFQDEMKELGYL